MCRSSANLWSLSTCISTKADDADGIMLSDPFSMGLQEIAAEVYCVRQLWPAALNRGRATQHQTCAQTGDFQECVCQNGNFGLDLVYAFAKICTFLAIGQPRSEMGVGS